MRKVYRVKEVITINNAYKPEICGQLLPTAKPISYLGEIDPKTGILHGKEFLSGKIFVFPNAVGSTVGSYVIYALRKYNKAPRAVVVNFEDPVTIIASIISDIPLYKLVDIQVKHLIQYKELKACIKDGELVIEG